MNGSGASFKSAEIYLDNELVFSGAPASDGTLTWHWDTANEKASVVKIVVYDSNNNPTTFTFNVTISNSSNPVATTTTVTTAKPKPGFPAWLSMVILVIILLFWYVLRVPTVDEIVRIM